MKPLFARQLSRFFPLLLALSLLSNQSCYHVRAMSASDDSSLGYKSKTVHNYCWGLIQPKDVRPDSCHSETGLGEVRISTNLGYAFLTVVTLGVWCPMKVELKCAKPAPPTGTLTVREK